MLKLVRLEVIPIEVESKYIYNPVNLKLLNWKCQLLNPYPAE